MGNTCRQAGDTEGKQGFSPARGMLWGCEPKEGGLGWGMCGVPALPHQPPSAHLAFGSELRSHPWAMPSSPHRRGCAEGAGWQDAGGLAWGTDAKENPL